MATRAPTRRKKKTVTKKKTASRTAAKKKAGAKKRPARAAGGHFTPELFRFLRQLKKNNDRAWFEANKDRYLEHVRDPMLRFIEDFALRLGRISRHVVADARPQGGSMFRIHRDVRFSADKSPYKTAATAQFRHVRAKDVHAPGYYLHLGLDGVYAGTGLWRPDGPSLARIRQAIAGDPARWKRTLASKPLQELLPLDGEALKRPPRGFPVDHPLIDDLRRKDFITMKTLDEQTACRPDFVDEYARLCKAGAPLMKYLCEVLGLEW